MVSMTMSARLCRAEQVARAPLAIPTVVALEHHSVTLTCAAKGDPCHIPIDTSKDMSLRWTWHLLLQVMNTAIAIQYFRAENVRIATPNIQDSRMCGHQGSHVQGIVVIHTTIGTYMIATRPEGGSLRQGTQWCCCGTTSPTCGVSLNYPLGSGDRPMISWS